MADFLSSYTGQQIDNILSSVKDKINTNDIVDNSSVGEADTPASSRLMMEAYKAIAAVDDFLANKVLTIDKGDQSVNGRKTFNSEVNFANGAVVPTGKKLVVKDKTSDDNCAVNLALLKDHGITVDDSDGPGIILERLNTGYIKISYTMDSLNVIDSTQDVSWVAIGTATASGKMTYSDFTAKVLSSDTVANKVDKSTYDAKMSQLDNSIAARVLTSTYNNDLAAINSALGNRVLNSTYTTKMSQLDSAISGKVDTSTYNTAIASLQSSKVDVITYNSRQTDIDTALATKLTQSGQDGQVTVAASGSIPVVTRAKSNCTVIMVATTTTDGLVDVFEIVLANTSVIAVTAKVKNTSGTSPATFAANVSGSNVILVCANSASNSIIARYKVISSF